MGCEKISLKIRLCDPEIIDKIELTTHPCNRTNKHCANVRSCEILGQCMMNHPQVVGKSFKKELNKARGVQQVLNVFERYMKDIIKVKTKIK